MAKEERPANTRREIVSKIASSALILTGVCGVIFVIVGRFVDLAHWIKDPIAIVIAIMSILTMSLGIERIAIFDDIVKRIINLESATSSTSESIKSDIERFEDKLTRQSSSILNEINKIANVAFLPDERAVYEEAARILYSARDTDIIRATSFSPRSSGYDSEYFQNYINAITDRIALAKKRHGDLSYRLVVGYKIQNTGEPPDYVKESITNRRESFSQKNIGERLRIKRVDISWSIDVLIVNQSAIIGFPTLSENSILRFGLRLTDKNFVNRIQQWFDDRVWELATDETWNQGTAPTAPVT